MSRTSVGQRVRINFYFDEQMLDALRKLAAIKNQTYSELIRIACREYVLREGKAIIESSGLVKKVTEI